MEVDRNILYWNRNNTKKNIKIIRYPKCAFTIRFKTATVDSSPRTMRNVRTMSWKPYIMQIDTIMQQRGYTIEEQMWEMQKWLPANDLPAWKSDCTW